VTIALVIEYRHFWQKLEIVAILPGYEFPQITKMKCKRNKVTEQKILKLRIYKICILMWTVYISCVIITAQCVIDGYWLLMSWQCQLLTSNCLSDNDLHWSQHVAHSSVKK
jgi:hypothetical protein